MEDERIVIESRIIDYETMYELTGDQKYLKQVEYLKKQLEVLNV